MQMMSEEDRQQMEEELKRNLPQVLWKIATIILKLEQCDFAIQKLWKERETV